MNQDIRALKFFIKDFLEEYPKIKIILLEIKEFLLMPSKLITEKLGKAEKRSEILKEQQL